MRYFVAISEEAMLRLWMRDPDLLKPFARPFQIRTRHAAANTSSDPSQDTALDGAIVEATDSHSAAHSSDRTRSSCKGREPLPTLPSTN